MRRINLLLYLLLVGILPLSANGWEYRYWFDNEDSKAVTVQGESLHINRQIDVTCVPVGLHTINVQVFDGKLSPGTTVTGRFLRTPAEAEANVIRYWFDNDERSELYIDGTKEALIDVSHLPDGLHTLRVQSLPESAPSDVMSQLFLKVPQLYQNGKLSCLTHIDGKEYKHEEIGYNTGIIAYNLDVIDIPEGIHQLSVQIVTPSGAVSSTYTSYFLRRPTTGEMEQMKCTYSVDGGTQFSQAGTYNSGDFHFDLDVSSVADGLHKLTYMLSSPTGGVSEIKDAYFMKTHLGGNGFVGYEYWTNGNFDNRVWVDIEERNLVFNLIGLIPVVSEPLRSSSFTFAIHDGNPTIYPRNNFFVRFWDASARTMDASSSYTDYNMPIVLTGIPEIKSNEPVTKQKPGTNEIQWYRLAAQTGDSLSFKVDKACTLQLFAPSGKEMYNASGAEAAKWDGCHAWEDGEYYLALHDVTSTKGNTTTLEYQHIDKYAVLSHTPKAAGAAGGYIHMTLFGNGFDKLKSADISNGGSNIPLVTFANEDYANTTLEFYVPDNPSYGTYDLNLYFSDEGEDTTLTVANALRLEYPEAGNMEISIHSDGVVANPYPVEIRIRNTGNVEYQIIPLAIACDNPEKQQETIFMNSPIYSDVSIPLEPMPIFIETDNLLGKGIDGIAYPVILPYIYPKEEIVLQVGFIADPGDSFNIYAWSYRPWDASGYVDKSMLRSEISILRNNPPVENLTCDFDPCELASVFPDVAECICGITWADISLFANSYAAIQNRAYRERDRIYSEMCGDAYESPYRQVKLRSPRDIMLNALSNCTGLAISDERLEQAAGAALDHLRDIPEDNCPEPRPHRVSPPNPYDPNDIYGYVSESGSHYVGIDVDRLQYTIEFENDSLLATSSAHKIVLEDRLPEALDASTVHTSKIVLGSNSLTVDYSGEFVTTIDLRPEVNALAEISLSIDKNTNTVSYELRALDPMTLETTYDVMCGILPVNDKDGNGQGHVTFDVSLNDNVQDGESIDNSATITFDMCEPIDTPVWSNETDFVRPSSYISGIEPLTDTSIGIAFAGTDSRSGIWKYDLYCQMNTDGEWILGKNDVAEASCTFEVVRDVNYDFCVVATDMAGNREEKELTREYSYKNGNATSGVPFVSADAVGGDGRLYDLYGRRYSGKPVPGIYIYNGKKIIVR